MKKIKCTSSLFCAFAFVELFLSIFMLYCFPRMIPEIAYMYDDGDLPFYFYGYNALFLYVANVLYVFELIVGMLLWNKKSLLRLWFHACLLILMFVSLFGVFRYLLMTLKSVG